MAQWRAGLMTAIEAGLAPGSGRRAVWLRWPARLGLRRLAMPILLLAIWEIAGRAGWLSAVALPQPSTILDAGGALVRDGALQAGLEISLFRLLVGFPLGVVAGIALGIAVGLSARAEDLFDGTLQSLRAIPFLALAPMFSLWFGADEASKIALVCFGAVFPAYLNTVAGIRGVDGRLAEAARAFGVHGFGIVTEVVMPGAMPSILVGLRLSFSWALAALVSSELAGVGTGLGALVAQAREFAQTEIVILCVVIYALVGFTADGLARVAEWRLLSWRRSFPD
ncbi:ABC transporter permease [Tardiphaga sp.]|uniref:ABC transporter permease n=1 Tax=Tardiphaga sp. TaxID=1926292 RepID=UPI00352B5057